MRMMKIILNQKMYYKNNNISLFINLSDSEGLPVSIMEAMSFGIPCVATDVGGTSEIVIDGYNGYLVSPKDDNESIMKKIHNIIDLQPSHYQEIRSNAHRTWDLSFNADKNYKEFIEQLMI